ncbi:hypothetical protein [Embleya sp. NPDC001921]
MYFTHETTTGAIGIDTANSRLPHGLAHTTTAGDRFAFTRTT